MLTLPIWCKRSRVIRTFRLIERDCVCNPGYEDGKLSFSSDYVSGRMMKTEIIYELEGKVTLQTGNRGKSAERWLTHLQRKRHIQSVK